MRQDRLGNPINCDSDRPLSQCVCMLRKKIKEKVSEPRRRGPGSLAAYLLKKKADKIEYSLFSTFLQTTARVAYVREGAGS